MTSPHPVHPEHGTPSPRDRRVLRTMESSPKLGDFTQNQQETANPPSTLTLVLPLKLSYPHSVRIRFPNLPGREPSGRQVTLAIRPDAQWKAHHLITIAHSSTALYWAFMTGEANADTTPNWQNLPIPPEPSPPPTNKIHSKNRNQAAFDRYGFSTQDRATIADALKYVVIPTLTQRAKGNRKQATPAHMETYANRIKLQLDEFLKHVGQELRPTFHMATPTSTIQACRLDLVPVTKEPATPEHVPCPSIKDLLDRLSPTIAEDAAQLLDQTSFARIYDGAVWLIKPRQERYWTQAAALNDADMIFNDHMQADQPASGQPVP